MSAAIETYVEANQVAGKLQAPYNSGGGMKLKQAYLTFAKGTESDGTVYRLWTCGPEIIPVKLLLACDAIAGLTAVDAGLWVPGVGKATVIDNCLASAVDIHAGAATLLDGTAFNMLAAIAHNGFGKKLWELAGHTEVNKLGAYDLALTLDTGGANTGNISALFTYAAP